MSVVALIDTGVLVALLNRREEHHSWARARISEFRPPMRTCEAVVTEAFHLLRSIPGGRSTILEMMSEGVLQTTFVLQDESRHVMTLIDRYVNVPMSLADACLVRMSELLPQGMVLTLDSDFTIFRKNRRERIPLVMPPGG